jgi:hypothetical protein
MMEIALNFDAQICGSYMHFIAGLNNLSTDIGKYYFVNRTMRFWNQLPAEVLASFPFRSHIFRKVIRKVTTSVVK